MGLLVCLLCRRRRKENGSTPKLNDEAGGQYIEMNDAGVMIDMDFTSPAPDDYHPGVSTPVTEIRELAINADISSFNTIDSNEIVLGMVLGKGAEGVVRAAEWQGGAVAVKIVDMQGVKGEEMVSLLI